MNAHELTNLTYFANGLRFSRKDRGIPWNLGAHRVSGRGVRAGSPVPGGAVVHGGLDFGERAHARKSSTPRSPPLSRFHRHSYPRAPCRDGSTVSAIALCPNCCGARLEKPPMRRARRSVCRPGTKYGPVIPCFTGSRRVCCRNRQTGRTTPACADSGCAQFATGRLPDRSKAFSPRATRQSMSDSAAWWGSILTRWSMP